MVKAWIKGQEHQGQLHEASRVLDQLPEKREGTGCCTLPTQVNQGSQHLSETPQKAVEDIRMVFEVALLGHQVVTMHSQRKLPIF